MGKQIATGSCLQQFMHDISSSLEPKIHEYNTGHGALSPQCLCQIVPPSYICESFMGKGEIQGCCYFDGPINWDVRLCNFYHHLITTHASDASFSQMKCQSTDWVAMMSMVYSKVIYLYN